MKDNSYDLKKKINCLASELANLRNRLLRYQRRLWKEGIKVTKARKLSLEFIDLDNINPDVFEAEGSRTIPIYRKGNDADADILLKLAKETCPSVYRRFIKGREIYAEKYSQLEKLMKNSC